MCAGLEAVRWKAIEGLKIAVDGPSGSGKGTLAANLAAAIGLPVLDTGLLYRFLGWHCLQQGISLADEVAVVAQLETIAGELDWRPEGIFFQSENRTPLLRGEDMGIAASKVAAMPGVRARLLDLQRNIAAKGCVMDGRDIGTVVLPDAQAKFFLTATQRERARRRCLQLQEKGLEASLEQIFAELQARDLRDSGREHSPLQQAEDAIHIDSTTMRVDEVLDRMLGVLKRRGLIQEVE